MSAELVEPRLDVLIATIDLRDIINTTGAHWR